MKRILQEKKIIEILKEYNNKYGVLLEASKLKILTDKVGFSEPIAKIFDELCGPLAIWMANKLYKHYVQRTKSYNVEGNMTPQEIKEFTISEINKIHTPTLTRIIIPMMDYIRVGLNGNKSSLEDDKWSEIFEKQKQWHDSLGVGEGKINYIENAPILIDFRNEDGEGFYWADLNVKNSPEECERMGHCGRSSYGYLYSLRSDKKLPGGKFKINKSHVTASIGTDGILYQMKGPRNEKPKEEFHKYIQPLFYLLGGGGEEDDYLIQGFGTEYAAQQDFKLTDLPNQTIRELYSNRPELFNTRSLQRKLSEMGIVEVQPLQTTFTLEIDPKDVGDYLSGDYVYKTYGSAKDQKVKRVYFYETIMSDDAWEMWDNYDADWKSALEYNVDSENEKKIEEIINSMIEKQGGEVDEDMSLVDKIEEYDENYDIRNAISSSINEVESNEYVKYLRDTIKDALNELGNVFEFTNDNIKIQVDLNDFGFPEDELDEYYENCYDDPACVFRELVSEDNIDLPKPSFDDRWYPSIDEDDFNQYLSDRLYDI
jgi:hypothetical protein